MKGLQAVVVALGASLMVLGAGSTSEAAWLLGNCGRAWDCCTPTVAVPATLCTTAAPAPVGTGPISYTANMPVLDAPAETAAPAPEGAPAAAPSCPQGMDYERWSAWNSLPSEPLWGDQ